MWNCKCDYDMKAVIVLPGKKLYTSNCINMREYGFSVARILLYKDKIWRIRVIENPYSRIFYTVSVYQGLLMEKYLATSAFFSSILWSHLGHFSAQALKIKKYTPWKKFLIFSQKRCLALRLKTFLYFGKWEMELSDPRLEKLLCFGERNFLVPRLKKNLEWELSNLKKKNKKIKKS